MSGIQIWLRAITDGDLPDYVRWLSDPEVTQFLSMDFEGITLEREREWLKTAKRRLAELERAG